MRTHHNEICRRDFRCLQNAIESSPGGEQKAAPDTAQFRKGINLIIQESAGSASLQLDHGSWMIVFQNVDKRELGLPFPSEETGAAQSPV
jgi:hypothetical protein